MLTVVNNSTACYCTAEYVRVSEYALLAKSNQLCDKSNNTNAQYIQFSQSLNMLSSAYLAV